MNWKTFWRRSRSKVIDCALQVVDKLVDFESPVPDHPVHLTNDALHAPMVVTYHDGRIESFKRIPRFKVLSERKFYICDQHGEWVFKGQVSYLSLMPT